MLISVRFRARFGVRATNIMRARIRKRFRARFRVRCRVRFREI
jgi:hypothetical protein